MVTKDYLKTKRMMILLKMVTMEMSMVERKKKKRTME